jgi:signal transduction histidine kinase
VNILTQTYRAPDGWDAAAIYALSQIARLNNVDVAVYSPRGQLLFTVQGRHLGGGMMGGGNGMMGGGASGATPAPQVTSLSRDQFEVQSYPVVADGQKVGTAEIYAPRNARAAAESAYQTALTRNLVIAALVAAVLAFLISLFVSRRITGPLEELTDAAEDVAGGNLAVRVSPRADDEVGALAAAFNAMADRLARDEQWRRDMTADLSHELRTPLATMQSRIEALEDGVLPATPENLRVGRDSIAHAETVYAAKGVTLDGDLAPATVKGDRDRLLQVAANLLDNALKFTTEGGRVVLAVASGDGPAGASASGGPWATLTVADSGPGIDPIDLPFIFDRFYRSQAARGTQGVGLGLAIARGLVEAQGGVIEVAARPEGGAEFTVRLPAAG